MSTSTLQVVQTNDYAAIVTVVIVIYDYALTFSREIDYVWCTPWSWITALFVVVRYVGLCWNITYALAGSAFVSGTVEVSVSAPFTASSTRIRYGYYFEGTAMLLVGNWGYVLFLAAADLVMVLRVYAMWGRSRIIFCILFFIYVAEIVISFVWDGIYEIPNETFSVTIAQGLDFTYCTYSFKRAAFSVIYRAIPRFVLAVILLIFVVTPAFKQTVEMYKLTKYWHTSQVMKLLVREGVLYFILTLFFNILTIIRPGSPLPTDLMVFLVALSYSVSSVIMPRFIMGIRETYARDVRDQRQGIDTGFGVFSQPLTGEDTAVSAVEFAGISSGEGQTTEGATDDLEAFQSGIVHVRCD